MARFHVTNEERLGGKVRVQVTNEERLDGTVRVWVADNKTTDAELAPSYTATIKLNERESSLLKFLDEYVGSTGNELGPALEAYREVAFLESGATIDNALYLLARAGFVNLDINASRSRYWVVK